MRNFVVFAVSLAASSVYAQSVSNDGSLNYTYVFSLPKARSRYQPALALTYNSNGGATAFGVGWSLSANYIDASTRASPTAAGDTRIRYRIVRDGATQLLVPSGDGTSYRPDVSQSYFSVRQTGATAWQALDGVGNTYNYTCVVPNLTTCSRWYLTSVTDPDSNATYFDYGTVETTTCAAGITPPGTALLTRVRYNFGTGSGSSTALHQVALHYDGAAHPESEGLRGCVVTHDQKLTSVSVWRAQSSGVTCGAGTCPSLGSWTLSYSTSRDTSRTRLDSIQAVDRNGNALGIPTSFTYETDLSPSNTIAPFDGAVSVSLTQNSVGGPTSGQCRAWLGLAWAGSDPCEIQEMATFIDMNGDGLVDMVWGGANPIDGVQPGLRWARNITRPARPPNAAGTVSFADVAVLPGSEAWAGIVTAMNVDGSTSSVSTGWTSVNTLLMDVNGDGFLDLVTAGATSTEACGNANVSAANPNQFIAVRFGSFTASPGFSAPVCFDVSAPLAKFRSLFGTQGAYLPLVYTQQGSAPAPGAAPPIYTWMQLVDVTGDGIADFVIADPNTGAWYVYRGYRGASNWGFSSSYITMHPVTRAQVVADLPDTGYPIRETFGTRWGVTMGGEAAVDLRDINGDGLPDRLVLKTWTDNLNVQHKSWYVEYNAGTDFVSLNGGVFVVDAPGTTPNWVDDGYVSSQDTAFLDLNRDGRPEFVARSDTCTPPTQYGEPETLAVYYNNGSGLQTGSCIPDPSASYQPLRPYGNIMMQGDSLYKSEYNESLVDLDGDGVLDYVRATLYGGNNQYSWSFYKGRHQSRRSDLLLSVTNFLGATLTFHWSPSSDYGVAPGMRVIQDVVASVDQSGPAMDPLTTTFVYATQQVTTMWDDPAGSEPEPLGFAQKYDLPSVGKLAQQTTFGSQHWNAGVPTSVYVGTILSPPDGKTPPSYSTTQSVQSTWSTKNIPSCAANSLCYPVYLYLSAQNKYRTELGALPVSASTNDPPDAYGNILSASMTGDLLSSASTSVKIGRAFATGSGAGCVACLLEEIITDPSATTEYAHRYLHYDLPSGQTSNSRNLSPVVLGHFSYEELLAAGNGTAGQYEIPQIVYYDNQGKVSSVVKSYSGQRISSVVQSFSYDPFSALEVTSRSITDGSTTIVAQYQWNQSGDLTEVDGPYLAGATHWPVLARAYDAAGRIIAEAKQPITAGVVSNPMSVFEYVTASTTAPALVRSYTFGYGPSEGFSYALSGGVPTTDDSVQTITYFDGLGRRIQSRTRQGSGTAGTTGSVVKQLPGQYVVMYNVILDGLGRLTGSLEPYFSGSSAYVDPRTSTELVTSGLHAKTVAYDSRSRPICVLYSPVAGSIPTAPTDPASCVSSLVENTNYKGATKIVYGVDSSLDSRPYLTVDTTPSSALAGANSTRQYLDSLGRTRYVRTPNGTYEQTTFDQMGRRTAVLRYNGVPGSAGLQTVTSSWSYDKRGRVSSEFADASGTKWYLYLQTGELSEVVHNAALSTSDTNAVWSVFVFGSLGRIVERDDFRWEKTGSCTWQPQEEVTAFSYDAAYQNNTARYGTMTAGLLTSAANAAATVAFGYNDRQQTVLRDEWTGDGLGVNSVSDTYGADGRLLTRALTSPYLAAYNSISTFGYAVGYDSFGHAVQVNSTYDSAGVFQAISATSASSAYWLAGTGNTSMDPATGPYDALNRLSAAKWDSGAITKTNSFLPGSNLVDSYATTLTGPGTNVYSSSSMRWQGTLLAGYTVTSAWEGDGTSHSAAYDADAHLQGWSATPLGATGAATQQFNETYTFALENIQQVNATNSLGLNMTTNYQYADGTSKERVTAMTTPSAAVSDYFSYDRRGRGLIAAHRLSPTQNPAQDSYEYDSLGRLISISRLGSKVEDLAYDPIGDLVSRHFTNGTDTARYYIGDHLTLVQRGTTKIGYAHIRLGGQRLASFWVKGTGSTNTSGIIYYHREQRGDVVATTVGGGQMGVSYRYVPSGAVDKTVGTEADENASDLGFIGGLKLSGGLIHLKARVYSPLLKRFLQPDTVDLRRYTYAHGDPRNFADPNGMEEQDSNSHIVNEENPSGLSSGLFGTPPYAGPAIACDRDGNCGSSSGGSATGSASDWVPFGWLFQGIGSAFSSIGNWMAAHDDGSPPPSWSTEDLRQNLSTSSLGASPGPARSGITHATPNPARTTHYTSWSVSAGFPVWKGWAFTYTESYVGEVRVASFGISWGKTLAFFGVFGASVTSGNILLDSQAVPLVTNDQPTISAPGLPVGFTPDEVAGQLSGVSVQVFASGGVGGAANYSASTPPPGASPFSLEKGFISPGAGFQVSWGFQF